ncbi:IPT/TIG domain-containing protein [Formosa algae]|uniref:IPT/TIG domain-containing protein n=1 Tax=Formosa algae TaxID=225843 RepID=UPI001551DC68|nr:IPT/TIG domain-containing protein [Formosa algae]
MSLSFYGQTVTDVFPTRVTYQTKVTIIGSGFTSGMENNITIISDDISVTSKTWVSATEMTFVISRSEHTTNLSSYRDRTGDLRLNSIDTGFDISYIAPNYKILQNSSTSSNDVTKITEIFTNWDYNGNGYWRSSWYNSGSQSTWPNDSHELLAFTFDGITYSTGVDDALLSTISGLTFTPQNFKAYSTNGVEGDSHSNNFIATGDLVDGQVSEGTTITSNFIKGLTVYDVITDGVNGLDLGTGITNFNETSSVKFFSGNGQVGAVEDDVPDLIITQIAQPGHTNNYDVYYYADEEGNVVGRPVKLTILDQSNGAGLLAFWRLDLYSMTDGSYATSSPLKNALGSNATRPLRMAAFKLEDFGISSDPADVNGYVENVNNINLMAGGSCDIAFMAYNKSAFEIKAPVADALLPRYVCRLPSTTDITFSVSADVDGGGTGSSSETLSYEWSKYNEDLSVSGTSLTINNVEEDDLATYNVRVYNDFGSIIVPVTLAQGGTPTAWDGTSWSVPSAYSSAGITINDEDKSLIFYDDYNKALDLEGCDCTVKAGTNVVIPSGQTLKLYDDLIVEPYQAAYTDSDGNTISAVSAGSFTLKNNASLVQIKDTEGNINEGVINIERLADNLHASDYVYWSSPVEDFYVTGIPNSRIYKWDPTEANAKGTTGDWVYVSSEIMGAGEGYIVRVPSASSFTTSFNGRPNNATIDVAVKKVYRNYAC